MICCFNGSSTALHKTGRRATDHFFHRIGQTEDSVGFIGFVAWH